jgi:hypothetical protein
MRDLRNPFRLRRAENIDTDEAFLLLFEPGILEIIPQDSLWDTVHVIRSAAGGGKSSLIRMFTPSSLNTLARRGRNDEKTRELYQKMKDFDAIDESGPSALGVVLTCNQGYSMLQDLRIEQTRKDRYFYGLLNSRIILAVLRGAVELKGLNFPDDLHRILITTAKNAPPWPGITFPCDGQKLHKWAEDREASLCRSLDSLGPLKAETLPGDDSLYSLDLMAPANLSLDKKPIGKRVLLMMDDVHKLTGHQRSLLLKTIIEARSAVGVWIAERFEALSPQEIFAPGAEQGRDYGSTIEIENFWRAKADKFEKLTTKVGDRRIKEASDTAMGSFRGCLQESLSGSEWDQRFGEIAVSVAARVKEAHGSKERFQEWISSREAFQGTPKERATEWRGLEILIARELNKRQTDLWGQEPLKEEELGQKNDSSLLTAADLFLAKEFKLPYYFGSERVARLASLNIQQFLGLGSEVFEEAAAAEIMHRASALPADRQHSIMKEGAKQLWDEIPKKVRNGRPLRNLLESIGKFAHWYTYRATAPNDPGVNGTAIRMSERAKLFHDAAHPSASNAGTVRLADLLATALSHNLLVAQLDYNCKGEKWMILNLNRLLAVHFDLPLGYGLYKERPLKTLAEWIDRPFTDPTTPTVDDLL